MSGKSQGISKSCGCGNHANVMWEPLGKFAWELCICSISLACMAGVIGEGVESEKTSEKWWGAGEEKGKRTLARLTSSIPMRPTVKINQSEFLRLPVDPEIRKWGSCVQVFLFPSPPQPPAIFLSFSRSPPPPLSHLLRRLQFPLLLCLLRFLPSIPHFEYVFIPHTGWSVLC